MRGAAAIGAAAIAVVAVLAGRAYKRPDPVPEPQPPGMTTGSDSVTLAADAPQWAIVHTALPGAPEPRWGAPLPARVVFDESRTSRLGSPLAGRVSAIFAERGQAVKSGQPLFAVSSPNLAELRAARDKAVVEQKTSRANFERTQSAVEAQVLPEKELVAARQNLAEADLALKLAQQKLASLRVGGAGDAATFTVTAPREGVVVEKTVSVGQPVSPDNGNLIAIADLSSVWVVADIFGVNRLTSLAVGTKAKITIGNNDTERDGQIDQISGVVDPDRHSVPVRIRLDNPDGLLRPNAYVQVRLFDPTPTKATLPASAVMSDGKASFVYVENPKGVLKRRNIEVGSVIGGRVPVTEGLEPTERVVTQGVILVDNQIDLVN
jgi:RND family efflux transporter MFP subunit